MLQNSGCFPGCCPFSCVGVVSFPACPATPSQAARLTTAGKLVVFLFIAAQHRPTALIRLPTRLCRLLLALAGPGPCGSALGLGLARNWSRIGPKLVQDWSRIGPDLVQTPFACSLDRRYRPSCPAAAAPPVRIENLPCGWVMWPPRGIHVLDRRYSYATTAILSDNDDLAFESRFEVAE